jgi:hypothetical protein
MATSLKGKGTILEMHPSSISVVNSYFRWGTNPVHSEEDLPKLVTTAIQGDIDPLERYPNVVALLADVKIAVRGLIANTSTRGTKTEGLAKIAQDSVEEWRVSIGRGSRVRTAQK